MARISVAATARGRTVTVHGKLEAADLQRLEHACGPALEQPTPRLAVVIRHGGVADSASRAYLDRLQARGVLVLE